MSDATFHVTKEDLRKAESRESRRHPHGEVPADSDVSQMKSIIDKNKPDPEETRRNLPLPDDPPEGMGRTMESMDMRNTGGIGSGRLSGGVGGEDDPLREPVTQVSSARVDGKVMHKKTLP
ncbi:hypothetical protein EDC01DRAFT_785030 [Geopyxis carbonaria]|nr:hypothetical protein EDC01DRAFT_785030 [Geopyxis carbonaria]